MTAVLLPPSQEMIVMTREEGEDHPHHPGDRQIDVTSYQKHPAS